MSKNLPWNLTAIEYNFPAPIEAKILFNIMKFKRIIKVMKGQMMSLRRHQHTSRYWCSQGNVSQGTPTLGRFLRAHNHVIKKIRLSTKMIQDKIVLRRILGSKHGCIKSFWMTHLNFMTHYSSQPFLLRKPMIVQLTTSGFKTRVQPWMSSNWVQGPKMLGRRRVFVCACDIGIFIFV